MKTSMQLSKSIYEFVNYYHNKFVLEYGFHVEINDKWEFKNFEDFKFSGIELYKRLNNSTGTLQIVYGNGDSRSDSLPNTAVAIVQITRNNITIEINAISEEIAKAWLEEFKKAYVIIDEPPDGKVSVRFWYQTGNGPTNSRRTIDVPNWEEIKDNYDAKTKAKLNTLMKKFRPSHGGQILLWHGLPGTGKTYALRALCSEWREWASAEYILDPEVLFGASPQYLASLVLESASTIAEYDEEDNPVENDTNKWKLLIMEDTGELISENAKERTGQGLSRLLNLADGFIGQGLKVLCIITTNETIDKLNPAVARPGRAASIIHFEQLSPTEVKTWAENNGIEIPIEKKVLADLYGAKEQNEITTLIDREPDKIGFKI